jgi:hypothetical protein
MAKLEEKSMSGLVIRSKLVQHTKAGHALNGRTD